MKPGPRNTLDQNSQLLDTFEKAWSARNVSAVLECFHPEAWYFASVGVLPAARAVGLGAIGQLVESMFAHDDGSEAIIVDRWVGERSAWWKWIYRMPSGEERFGCDEFTFRGGLIASKDAFRKSLTAPAA